MSCFADAPPPQDRYRRPRHERYKEALHLLWRRQGTWRKMGMKMEDFAIALEAYNDLWRWGFYRRTPWLDHDGAAKNFVRWWGLASIARAIDPKTQQFVATNREYSHAMELMFSWGFRAGNLAASREREEGWSPLTDPSPTLEPPSGLVPIPDVFRQAFGD